MLREEFAIRFFTPLLVFALTLSGLLSAHAQTSPKTESPRPAEQDQSTAKSAIRFSLEANSRFGNYTYIPESWGEMRLRLEHSGEIDRKLLCTSYFEGQPGLQFGRQVWLPAHSKLTISHPILFPQAEQIPNGVAKLQSLLIEEGPQQSEVLLKTDSGQLRHDRSLLVMPNNRITGIIAGWRSDEFVPEEVVDLVVANRVYQGLNNKTAVLGDQFLPADETSLDYLDHLVLTENRLLDDHAGLAAVRRWLHAGGRLWVMLDRADPVILERLLGDEFHGELVDRVGLTSVRIDQAPTLTTPDGEPGETADHEEPVVMARMIVSGMKVWNTVNGWPAAMTRPYGQGRLLVTTLGPRGWLRPQPPLVTEKNKPVAPPPPDKASAYVPSPPMEDLAAYVLGQREPQALSAGVLESFAREHIAYHVPDRTLIYSTMGGFLAALLVSALWLGRMDGVEHFGWVGSLLAVIFGVAMTSFGFSSRYGVSGTVASVQVAQALGGTDDVRTRGLIAVYRPEGDTSLVQTSQGGKLWPDMSGLEGATRRMVTTDLGTYHWDGLPQTAGLRTYTDATSAAMVDRIEASATADGQGLVGRYTGRPVSGTDALLATRSGRIGVTLSADGTFTARADDVFEVDQYLAASFLGDEQDRRRRIFQELFPTRAWKDSLQHPQLLVWVNDWDHGFQFGEGLTHQGDTLLSVPVQISPPDAGSEFVIPSPLLSYSTRRPPDGSLPSGFWNDVLGEWQERASPSTTWLTFQIPRGLLPLKAIKARLDVKVSGPMGRLEILGVKQDAPVSLSSVTDPVGSLSFTIEDPEVLIVNELGEFALGISGGDPARPGVNTSVVGGTANSWKIDSLGLQLWATATERSEKD